MKKRKLRINLTGAIGYALMTAVIIWLWWFLRSYFLMAVFLTAVGSAAASAAILRGSRGGFCVTAQLPEKRIGKGSSFSFTMRIKNPRRLIGFPVRIEYEFVNVFTQAVEKHKMHVWAAPRETQICDCIAVSRFAGRVEVRIRQFVVYDFFRICKLTDCEKKDAWVIAYPKRMPADEEELVSCVEHFPEDGESRKRGIELNPDYDIREYIAGDELKNIHWKLTAKQGRLMVRERLAGGRSRMNLVLPLEEDAKRNDGLMDSLQSLAELLLREEYPVQIFWRGKKEELRTCFLTEQGELESVLAEILSGSGLTCAPVEEIQEKMAVEYPGESYILIRTGAYQGAYIP